MQFITLAPGHIVRLDCIAGVEVLRTGFHKNGRPCVNVILTEGDETHGVSVSFDCLPEAQNAAEKLCERIEQARTEERCQHNADRIDLFAAAALEGLLARGRWTADELLKRVLDASRSVAATLDANMPVRFRDGCSEY